MRKRLLLDFYCEILQNSDKLAFFTAFLHLFYCIQNYANQFIPFYIYNPGEHGIIRSIMDALLRFSKSYDKDSDYFLFPFQVIILIFAFLFVFYFWLFYRGAKSFRIISYTRSILFLFHPHILAFPLCIQFGITLNGFFIKEITTGIQIYILISVAFVLIIIILLTYLYAPILLQGPFLGHGSTPTKLIPNFKYHFQCFLDVFITILTLFGNDKSCCYFFSFTKIVFNIMKFIDTIKFPYLSSSHSITVLTQALVSIITQVLMIMILLETFIIDDLTFFLIGFPIFIVIYIMVSIFYEKKVEQIIMKINDDKHEHIHGCSLQLILIVCQTNHLISKKIKFDESYDSMLYQLFHDIKSVDDIDNLLDSIPFLSQFFLYKHFKCKERHSTAYIKDYQDDDFWMLMLEGKVNEALDFAFEHSNCAESIKKLCDSELKMNIRKLLKKKGPVKDKFVLLASTILIFCFIVILLYPSAKLLEPISDIQGFPPFLRFGLDIATEWVKMNLLFSPAINRTRFTNLTSDSMIELLNMSIPELREIQYKSIVDYYKNLDNISKGVLTNMNGLFNHNFQISYPDIGNFWFNTFINFSQVPPVNISLRGTIGYLIQQIILYFEPLSPNESICDTNLVNVFRSQAYNYLTMMDAVSSSFVFASAHADVITGISEDNPRFLPFYLYIIGAISWILSMCMLLLWKYFKIKEFYKMLTNSFRISYHPTIDIEIEPSEEVTPFHQIKRVMKDTNVHILFSLFIIMLIVAFLFIQEHIFNDIIQEILMTLSLNDVFLTFGSSLLAFHRVYQFGHSYDGKYKFLATNYTRRLYNLHQTLTVAKSKLLSGSKIPEQLQLHLIDEEIESLHDIYMQLPIVKQFEFISFLLLDIPRVVNLDLDPNHVYFLHLQHLFTDHACLNVYDLSTEILDNSLYNVLILQYVNLGEFIFAFVLLMAYLVSVCHLFMLYKRLDRFFKVIILRLDPVFIASQKNLVDYLIKHDSSIDNSPLYSLFEKANIALVYLSPSFTIMQVTTSVLKLFHFRSEQLVGQNINLIISPEDSNFYNKLESGTPGSVYTHGLVNNTVVDIHVHIFIYHNMKILQIVSLDEIQFLDELVQAHKDIYYDLLSSAFPIERLKMPNNMVQEFYTSHYDRYVFLFMKLINNIDSDSVNNKINEENKDLYRYLVPYLRESIILSIACTHVVMIFIDNNPLKSAIECYKGYGEEDRVKCAFISEGRRLTTYFYDIPDITEEIKTEEECYENYALSLGVEPIIPFSQLINQVQHMIPGFLLSNHNILNYIDKGYCQIFEDDKVLVPNEHIDKIRSFTHESMFQKSFMNLYSSYNSDVLA